MKRTWLLTSSAAIGAFTLLACGDSGTSATTTSGSTTSGTATTTSTSTGTGSTSTGTGTTTGTSMGTGGMGGAMTTGSTSGSTMTTGTAMTTSSTSTGMTGPFDCAGMPLPTTAPDPVAASGTAQVITTNGTSPANGATIKAFKNGSSSAVAMDTADMTGHFDLSLATGGTPWDGYFEAQLSGDKDSYLYPPVPIFQNASNIPVQLISQQTFSFLGLAVGQTQSATKGFIVLQVSDCQLNPVAGAIVTNNGAGTVKYDGANGQPSTNATMTSADGIAYIFNTTAGDVQVDASVGALSFREHTVNARAGAFTITALVP